MIKYNYAPYNGTISPRWLKEGTPTEIISVAEIDLSVLANLSKENRPWIQMFDSGYRLGNISDDEATKMQFWNGCVFVDIDSAKYTGKYANQFFSVFDKFTQQMQWNLTQKHQNNFYWLQKSHSGKSLHIVFYFSIEKTVINFKKCALAARNAVIDEIHRLLPENAAEDLIRTPGVIDDCGSKIVQLLYMSGHPILYNMDCEPNGEFKDIDSVEISIDETETDLIDAEINVSDKIEFKKFDNSIVSDWSHLSRFSLAKVFAHTFLNDSESAEKAYMAILPYIADNVTNHSLKDLQRLFRQQYKNTVLKPVLRELQKPKEQRNPVYSQPSAKMLKLVRNCFSGFDYRITTVFNPQRIDRTDYTKEYKLQPNQFISDVLGDILSLPNNFIHIEAGCGLGKTFALKEWIKQQQTDSDNLFDVQSKKRVCFVTPMTSINRDNFTDESDWVIIDSEHKGAINQISDKSVCTTWNSFILFEMDQMNFDLYVFDESHSLFLYDYRAKDIAEVLYSLNRLHQQNKRVVLMSGTPSKDRELFSDMAKVKVTKDVSKIPANVIVYQEQYNGWLFNDVREWIKDKTHVALVMYDYANLTLKESFEKRGISVDLLYNKRFDEDVAFVNSTHSLKGQVTLCSTYGQAGINIYADSNQLVRLYIISDCALSIIQYANRIRNKDRVESINIVYKAEKVRNSIKPYSVPDRYDLEQRLAVINSSYSADKDWLIECRLGLREMYLKEIDDADGKRVRAIDNDIYNAFVNCGSVVMYESQLQLIYNRLADANFLFNIVQMQSDVKDDYKDKKTGKVASVLENRNVIMKCVEMTKNGLVINDRTDKQLRKLIDDSTQKKLESIVNYLFDQYTTDEKLRNEYKDYIVYISDVYCKFVEKMKQQHPDKSVCKADVKRWSDVVELRKKINSEKVADSILLKYLSADVSDSDLMQYAASHVALVYSDSWNNFEVMQQMADETYKALKELRKEIREFSWFFGDTDAESVKVMQSEKSDDELIEIKSKLVAYLSDKHTRGKANKKMIRAFRANGVWEFEFQSVNECASHFGVSGVSMAKYIKSGKYISDLGYSFVEIK